LLKYSQIHKVFAAFYASTKPKSVLFKIFTSKAEDFVGFLFEPDAARLSPCKNESGKKHRNIRLCGGFGLFVLPYTELLYQIILEKRRIFFAFIENIKIPIFSFTLRRKRCIIKWN